jgi:hypothetical protein
MSWSNSCECDDNTFLVSFDEITFFADDNEEVLSYCTTECKFNANFRYFMIKA